MSLGTENGLSASDVALLSGNGNRGGNGAWNGEWLIALIVLFMFPMMFGRNGIWGNGSNDGNGGGGVNTSYIPYAIGANGALTRSDLCAEFNANDLQNAVRGIQQGICDSTFALNNSINTLGTNVMQGFNTVNQGLCNLGYNVQQGINGVNTTMMQGFNAQNVAYLQGQNALASQLASCCCDQRTGMLQMQSNIDGHFCTTNYNNQANTTSIIQNAHNDTDRVLARLDAMENARKDERIAQLEGQLQAANTRADFAGQRAYIDAVGNSVVSRLQPPTPVPSYQVPNPFTGCCGVPTCGGCGC